MKTNPPIHRLLARVACPILAMAAISCQITRVPSSAEVPPPVTRSAWVKVSSRPPTWYPRGVAADCPTDHWAGEWVLTEDDLGTRYFIPFGNRGNVDRQSLVRQALAARSAKKIQQIAAEDRDIRNEGMVHAALYGPLVVSVMAMGGGMIMGSDIDRWKSEWYSSKHMSAE